MNAVTDDNAPDLEQLFERIDDLEELVKRQKDFIDHSGDTWRRLLEEEQDRSRRTVQERARLETEVRKLEELGTHREIERVQLQEQLAVHGVAHPSAAGLRQENEMLAQKLAMLEQETAQRVRSLELARAELQDQLRAQVQTEQVVARVGELEDKLAHVQSELRQRQEEIEQTRAMLAERFEYAVRLETELEHAKARETALRTKLEAADGWVFQLAGERTAKERQLVRVERERDAKSRELHVAQAHITRLRTLVNDLSARPSVQATAHATETTQAVETPQLPQTATVVPKAENEPASSSLDAVLKPVRQRDKQQLLHLLLATPAAPSSSVAEDVPVVANPVSDLSTAGERAAASAARAMPLLGQARSNELERKLRDARQHADWLRRLSVVLLRSPKPWWSKLMPLRTQRQQLLETLEQEGIFDGRAYLERNADVAQAGLDPLRHYLQHGIDEGRDR